MRVARTSVVGSPSASQLREQHIAVLRAAIAEGDCFTRNHLEAADLAYDQALEAAVYSLQQRRKFPDYRATLDLVLAASVARR